MKISFYKILSYVAVTAFLLYWAGIFILAVPSGRAAAIITYRAPLFKNMFSSSWNLFTRPYTYHNRLYIIARSIERPQRADTMEVLEQLALQKQHSAPFNQKENIIDHLVNNNVEGLVRLMWADKQKPSQELPGPADTAYIAHAMAAMETNTKYIAYRATLNNYCKLFLKENKIDTTGKEIKIVIKEKMIRPFNEVDNKQFKPKETLVFETDYNSATQ